MSHFIEQLHDINYISITVRSLLALLLGGLIGLERGRSRHPAGFRTHILVCIGAATVMMTNQYMYEVLELSTDTARLGAQVITGIGFLGAGTIIVSSRHRVTGLTTAAGLWATACLGLAIGIGFYYAAILVGCIMFITIMPLAKIENKVYMNSRSLDLYIEISDLNSIQNVISSMKNYGIIIHDNHISSSKPVNPSGVVLHAHITTPKNITGHQALEFISNLNGVYLVEEI